MRSRYVFYSFACSSILLLVFTQVSLAGVISSLSKVNNTDDYLSDDSLGYIIDYRTNNNPFPNTPFIGDISIGIAKINVINGDSFTNSAYLVYSLQISGISGNIVSHSPTPSGSGYSLGELLNFSGLPSTAVAVVLEVTGATNPFSDSTKYPFGTINYMTPALSAFISDLQTLSANSQKLFSVGITDTPSGQYFRLDTSSGLVSARLAVDWAAPGINLADFKPLSSDPPFTAAAFEVTLRLQQSSFPSVGGEIKTRDDGNYYVNYVPEPGSLVALAGLLCGGAGLGFLRRRRIGA
ncbi:MAG: PEP-CTERM sorting domain-containing protein [Thermogutta sp.]